jgi:DNA-binding CsgD family transcriptional regulator
MPRLRWKQTQTVLKALDVLYSNPEPTTLPTRILGAVKTAIAAETILVDGFNASYEMNSLAQYPADLMSPKEYAILAQHLPQHPLFPSIILKGQTTALRTSEVASGTKFHKTPLYNEMYRPMSIEDQLIVRVNAPQGGFVTCCLNRVKQEFAEADRRAIDLLGPHLASAIGSAKKLQRARSAESYLLNIFHQERRGIIVFGATGEIKYITDLAASLMQKYFCRRDFDGRKLPETLSCWVRQLDDLRRGKDYHPPLQPLTVKGVGAELRISLALHKDIAQQILLLEEKSSPSPASLQALGLTKREAEVLFWVAQGKSDSTVGVLYGISPRTVQVHLSHIYIKLGVENRTAATLSALELLQL